MPNFSGLFPWSNFGDIIEKGLEEEKIRKNIASKGCVHNWKLDVETESLKYYKCSKCKEEKREYNI